MRSWILMLGMCVAIAGFANSADAAFQVTLSAGGFSTTIVDGGVGDSDGMADSIINISTTVGGYTFVLTLATTNSPGTMALGFVSAGTNMISGSGATTISIYASASGFTLPSTPSVPGVRVITSSTAQLLSGTTLGNTADHSVNAYYDGSDTLSTSAAGTVIGSAGPATITAPLGSSTLTDTQVVTPFAAPYALNLELVAVLNDGGTNILDLDGGVDVSPIPEPVSLACWGGLLVVGCVVARRRSKNRRKPQQN